MSSNSDDATSLSQLWERTQQLLAQLETLQTTSSSYADAVRSAIASVNECKQAADRVSLFSSNETLDDLTTSSLEYLTLDSHLGDLLQKDHSSSPSSSTTFSFSPSARRASLLSARSAYSDFLTRLEQYELVGGAELRAWVRFNEDRDGFATVAPGLDASARRDAKIAALRDEKALRARLAQLRADPAVAARADDEAVRRLRLAEIRMRVVEALRALDMIAQELKMLALAPSAEEAEAQRNQRQQLERDQRDRERRGGLESDGDGYSDRLDRSMRSMMRGGKAGPILDARGRPMQPFVLMDRRTQLRKGVFRPGHSLPTMSIDEYLEEERRRGGIIEGGGEPPVVEPNEDDVEAADRETMKQRDWDEFKEENPRGSGNTINRG